jgi:peroxiredoxin
LLYTGSYAEEAIGQQIHFTRNYHLESRLFFLRASPQGSDVALLTILRPRDRQQDQASVSAVPSSVRLELVKVDPHGRLALDPPGALTVPLDGPATVECGSFVEVPRGRFHLGQIWEVQEEGRPPCVWKIVGSEVMGGVSCLKVIGLQQSEDWDQPRADRTAWRRQDSLWIAPNTGIAYRVERTLERREPARQDPTQRSTTTYNLESRVFFPGPLYEDRNREIMLAHGLARTAEPFLKDPEKNGSRPLDAILTKIRFNNDNQTATPYREALFQLQRRVQAARRGEAAPADATDTELPAPHAAINQPAPDFVVTDFTNHDSARLRRFLGRPIVMVFYQPGSKTASETLRFAQDLREHNPNGLTVLGLAMTDDAAAVLKQRAELKLTFPLLSGAGLRRTYDVEATPKLLVLDGAGIVRGAYLGWGQETPTIVREELKHWELSVQRK